MEASPRANTQCADALPPAPPPPAPVPPPLTEALPLDRKRTRALWASHEYAANECYTRRHLMDETHEEGEVLITMLSDRGRVLCDVSVDLRQGAGTLFGTLFRALELVGKADFQSAYDFTARTLRTPRRGAKQG
jgi:hypothetical protein